MALPGHYRIEIYGVNGHENDWCCWVIVIKRSGRQREPDTASVVNRQFLRSPAF